MEDDLLQDEGPAPSSDDELERLFAADVDDDGAVDDAANELVLDADGNPVAFASEAGTTSPGLLGRPPAAVLGAVGSGGSLQVGGSSSSTSNKRARAGAPAGKAAAGAAKNSKRQKLLLDDADLEGEVFGGDSASAGAKAKGAAHRGGQRLAAKGAGTAKKRPKAKAKSAANGARSESGSSSGSGSSDSGSGDDDDENNADNAQHNDGGSGGGDELALAPKGSLGDGPLDADEALALVEANPIHQNTVMPWQATYDEDSAQSLQEQRLAHRARAVHKTNFSLYSATSNQIEKPRSAYDLFVEENAAECDNIDAAWAVCNEKEKYQEMAKEDVHRYERELNTAHGVAEDGLFSLIMLAGKKAKKDRSAIAEVEAPKVSDDFDSLFAGDFAAAAGGSVAAPGGSLQGGSGAGSSAKLGLLNEDDDNENALACLNQMQQQQDASTNSGPVAQVRLDENGDIVLDDSLGGGSSSSAQAGGQQLSGNGGLTDHDPFGFAAGGSGALDVHAAGGMVASGSGMTRRKAQKWTTEETEKFYEAVRAFGYDLVLIHSVFQPNRTAAQIKAKYTQEIKKNPTKMDDAFANRTNAKKFFEKQKWKIDESSHWTPAALENNVGGGRLALEDDPDAGSAFLGGGVSHGGNMGGSSSSAAFGLPGGGAVPGGRRNGGAGGAMVTADNPLGLDLDETGTALLGGSANRNRNGIGVGGSSSSAGSRRAASVSRRPNLPGSAPIGMPTAVQRDADSTFWDTFMTP